jgi:hypothetical protein
MIQGIKKKRPAVPNISGDEIVSRSIRPARKV